MANAKTWQILNQSGDVIDQDDDGELLIQRVSKMNAGPVSIRKTAKPEQSLDEISEAVSKELPELIDRHHARMSGKYGFVGRRVKVRLDKVTLQSGKEMTYEIVEVADAVAVLAILPDNKVVILRNNRPPVEKELYEVPAGKIDPGEDAATAAKRELQEETGYAAQNIKFVGALYTSPGITTEKIHCFIATGLTKGEQNLEEAEQGIQVYELGLAEANTYLDTGDIEDMKTAYLLRVALVFAAME